MLDILDIKLRNLEDLITLSTKSRQSLFHHVKKIENLVQFKKTYSKYFECVWNENDIKIYIIVNSMNDDQKYVYFNIFDKIMNSSKGSISSIDACPGTGKTFLTACILVSCNFDSTYMVYTNRLSESMNNIYFEGVSITCCRFLMKLLKINYPKAKNLWNIRGMTLEEKCKEIQTLAKNHKVAHRLYIVDEDSVLSPFFIYFMYCLQVFHNIHLIFIGDKYQQIPINATKYHSGVNYELIEILAPDSLYTLTTNVRQNGDVEFVNILKDFLTYFKKCDNRKMSFAMKYFFYSKLHEKFNVSENFKAMFFAAYHRKLKARMLRYEKHLETNNIKYKKAYIHIKKNKMLQPVSNISQLKKFRPYIVLVIGAKYVYSPTSTVSFIVTLKEIRENTLKLHNEQWNRNIIVSRIQLNSYFTSEQLIEILAKMEYPTMYQFPIRELINTYHAAQGLTIANSQVELDLDCKSMNSFYVGLTRIKTRDQLTKIHTQDLLNLMYTKNQNDEYYYKIVEFDKDLKNIQFQTCNNLKVFESAKINLKIKKEIYENKSNLQSQETELMRYTKKIMIVT
ncbi:helicase 2 [Callinectes sapidus nudivirus]|nr:helicase 2 [Callinectes sapidus nudivirus]